MSLLDTADGLFMNFAYGWAFSNPVRKVYYNLAITGLSVAIACSSAGSRSSAWSPRDQGLSQTTASGASCRTSTSTPPASSSSACSWSPGLAALLVWRYGRIEEKWSARLQLSAPEGDNPGGTSYRSV